MKNKKVKSLSILLSVCMLGTSSAGAAEFSSGSAILEEMPGQMETEETQGEQEDPVDTGEVLTDQDITEKSEEAFGSEEDNFSDEENVEEFSAEEEIPEAEEVLAGSVDATLEAGMKSSVVEADIEADPNVKTTCDVYEGKNVEAQDYSIYGHCVKSYLTSSPDGGLMRVQAGAIDGKVLVEYYDNSYNIQRTVTVPLGLPVFGAFYENGNYYYILTGQNNAGQDRTKEVYRVTKYSKDWKVQGTCCISGINTVDPFDFGSARMVMDGKYLYIRTCRTMYKSVDGFNHQTNLTMSVDTSDMNLVQCYSDVSNTGYGYVSHSFNQFVQVDNGRLLGVDHGDTYPRALVLLKYNTDLSEGKFIPTYKNLCDEIHFMDFPGEGGNNYTGASVGGFEYSDSAYLTAGNYDGSGSSRNVFVSSVPKTGTTPTVTYFTNYSGEDSASTPYLIKTGNNQFMLMWSNRGTVYYTVLNGNGQQTGKTYSMTGNLSDCAPAVVNGKLIWYTWHDNVNVFYEINLSSLSATRAVKIVNGHQYVYGEVKDGRVARKCSRCGKELGSILVPTEISTVRYKKGNSLFYLESGQEFTTGQSTEISWEVQYKNWDSDIEASNECEISSSDESILSVKKNGDSRAEITAKKSGKVTLTITAKYNPDATFSADLYIDLHCLNGRYNVVHSPYSATYNGKEQKPKTILQTLEGGKWQDLQEGKDYTVSYEGDFINAGTYTTVVTGIGSYTGSLKNTFSINRKSLREGCTAVLQDSSVTYNGKEQKPDFVVMDGDRRLVPDKDYSITYRNNINVGTATATINGIGNYTSYLTVNFKITSAPAETKDISKCTVTLSETSFKYDGKEKKPSVTVKDGSTVLKEGTDYTVSYSDNVKAGTAKAVISGKGKYTGTVTKTFTITASAEETKDIAKCQVTLGKTSYVFDGTEKKPSVTVKDGSTVLKEGTDYTVSYSDNIKIGTAKVTITGKGKYTGTVTETFQIAEKFEAGDISDARVILSKDYYEYDGKEHKPTVSKLYVKGKLISEENYKVSYPKDLVNAGTLQLTITGTGSCTGSCTATFTIAPRRFSNCTVIVPKGPFYYYEGTVYKPKYIVKDGNKTLVEGKDYTVTYQYNDKPGHTWDTLRGMGNYANDTIQKQIYIIPPSFNECSLTFENDTVIYNGHPAEPKVIMKFGEKTLKLNQDYTVMYTQNDEPGTGIAYVNGRGDYVGFKILYFTVQKKNVKMTDISKAKVTISGNAVRYDGGKVRLPKITLELNGKVLEEDKDFRTNCLSTHSATTGQLIITGKGVYSGVIEGTIHIDPENTKNDPENTKKKDISDCTIGIGGDGFTYTGSAIKPKVQVSSETEDLTEGTDYTISYKNNVEVGTATAVAKGKGIYTGTLSITFKIRPVNTKTFTLKSGSKGKLSVSWKTAKSVSGYEIQYSRSQNMKNAQSVVIKGKTTKATLKNLAKTKKYYVRVRTYKTVKGKKYYSAWSSVKTVKVK